MKREIMMHKPKVCGCCPGHDLYPAETYKSRLSKKARSRDKKKEHKHVRTIVKKHIRREIISNEGWHF